MLDVGTKLQATYKGHLYAAEVVAVSASKKRVHAPIKVHYLGYGTECDTWLPLSDLKSKALLKAPTPVGNPAKQNPEKTNGKTKPKRNVAASFAERRRITVEANEGETVALAGESVDAVFCAFFGHPEYALKPDGQKERLFLYSKGLDVTEIVREKLSQHGNVKADCSNFGDPSPGDKKILIIEACEDSIIKLDNDDGEDDGEPSDSAELSETNRIPQRPCHYVLRPGSDPRLDQSMYVRYDPHPECKTGAIIIVIPGGNYDESGIDGDEGQGCAIWLVKLGITAVVLQYRVVSQGHYWPAQYDDWKDCATAVKSQASSWNCDAARIGVIGFSAGGHLAGYAAVKAELDIRPKLQVLVYPAIDTLSPRENGAIDPWRADHGYPPMEDSIHLLAHDSAPPAFLAGIASDEYCPAGENTDVYAKKLSEFGVPCEHVCYEGQDVEHGCGVDDWWAEPCASWLRQHGWASPHDGDGEAEEALQEEDGS